MNLLFHQGSLGDWVVTLPILQALIAQYGPTYAVTAWSKAQLAARLIPDATALSIEHQDLTRLFAASPTDSVIPAQSPDESAGNDWADRWRQARLLVSFLSDGDDAWADNVRRLAPQAKLYFVQPRPPADWDRHVRDWQLHQLEYQGLNLGTLSDTVERGGGRGARGTRGPIVIHPGSGGADKCWPADRYGSLIEQLRIGGFEVEPILGEVEMQRWPPQRIKTWMQRYSAREISDLDGLCDVLAGARAFVSNDSGPSHLAALLGVPSVVMFGPSSPALWAPKGETVTVLAPPEPVSMDWLDLDDVLAALKRVLAGQE